MLQYHNIFSASCILKLHYYYYSLNIVVDVNYSFEQYSIKNKKTIGGRHNVLACFPSLGLCGVNTVSESPAIANILFLENLCLII